jgi:porphobilinogen deaminase
LQSKHPFVEIEFLTRSTSGDKDLKTPLSEMPTEGVFTNDLRD